MILWYQKNLKEIFSRLKTDKKKGITQEEAEKRLKRYGLNVLPSGKQTTWVQFLVRQFTSPLIYILLIGAVLTIVLKEWVDMTVILLAVFVNVVVGFWQEFKSNNILKKLKEVVKTSAFVIRDGAVHEINAELLVPGDIILLKTGMKIPADARVIKVRRLEVDEAILTGESSPVGKLLSTIEEKIEIGDRTNMVHMGTVVSRGDGTAVVVGTGAETAFGKIALMTQQAEDEPTPLQNKMKKLGKILAIFVAVAVTIIFVVGIVEQHTFREMFVIAIAVAVAAIPEGLPAAISIILAVSAQRILRQKGVVKRLVAAETLGSASVICTDKTGTLTEGKMKIKKLEVGGSVTHALEILALANEGMIEEIEGRKVVKGDTTDRAKLQEFIDNGGNLDELLQKYPRISLLTFDSKLKYVASLHKQNDKKGYVFYVNGAPEIILDSSHQKISKNGSITSLTDKDREKFHKEYEELAQQGFRVLGIAERFISDIEGGDKADLEDENTRENAMCELIFVGLAAIRDPIRGDVRESIKMARSAGVKTIMMTGDHILTARAIGLELGFSGVSGAVVLGSEIEEWSDKELKERVAKIEIFARVNPEHKMRIIKALQSRGEVVAMTGDGVNDAPALKSADIGIAVGSGTDIAKEASDLILLNDSFSIIVAAIRQGRIAFDNIRKVTVFLLAGSFTELILVMSSLVLRIPLPITAVQILWTNLAVDSLPNVALSFEPGEKGVMKRPPLKKNEPVLDSESKIIIFVIGIFTDLVLLGVFLWFYYLSDLELNHIRTLIFTALGLATFFYVYSIKNLKVSIFSYNLFNNLYLVGATFIGASLIIAAVYVPVLNTLLGTVPLGVSDWLIILVIGIIEIAGVELAKWWFFFRKGKKKRPVDVIAGS